MRTAVECGTAVRTLPGQRDGGDVAVLQPYGRGLLAAAIDGVGHGREAAQAAAAAAAVLMRQPDDSVLRLVERCHAALRGTRGVVMSLAAFNFLDATMTWLGVGNVAGVLRRANHLARPAAEFLLLRGGVVGHNLPPLLASILPISPGDTMLLATDGISGGFWQSARLDEAPQALADRML
ncbi:MAG TPA: SpoIIE family protein phosphatase, partial [Vicinamibacterales bacterium]